MFRNFINATAFGVILCNGLFSAVRADGTQTQDLRPFTNVAYIPASSDLSTIRFEKARAVMVSTKIRTTTDEKYCTELAFRDPGGSAFCPSTVAESRVAAYEVTYSFNGPRMTSDEGGATRFTFHAYFRPEDLSQEARKAFSAPKRNQANIAEYFKVNTYKETVSRAAIDNSQSKFCEGDFVDGNWTRKDSRCAERIRYKTVSVPSDYLSVSVDPLAGVLSAKR